MKDAPGDAKASKQPPRSGSLAAKGAGGALKVVWIAFVITTPVLGAWVASSLAAYANGPVELAAASALLAFPVLPLAWEAWAERRRRRNKGAKPHVLTLTDRVVLRTLAINLLFLGVLVGTQPRTAFAALSTRGDWMLDGRQGPTATEARKRLFWAADRLEWLYVAFHDNPFEQEDDSPPPAPTGTGASSAVPAPTDRPSPGQQGGDRPSPGQQGGDRPSPGQQGGDRPSPGQQGGDKPSPSNGDKPSADRPPSAGTGGAFASTAWPAAAGELHPAVAGMPKDAETSIASVARYIAEREMDPAGRFRAAHDWVADRIAYDGPSYVAGRFPPQDAETVFRTRTGVCAGYAQLLAALGRALGLDVAYVVGDARTSGDSERGDSHAWSAVKIGDRTYLADATWDSGFLDGATFHKSFRTDYLFTPPHVFGIDHFPNDARWQLRDKPLTRGEFFRQAMMSPRFYAQGRELLSPQRSQVTVDGAFTAEIRTPGGLFTSATWSVAGAEDDAGSRARCKTEDGPTTRVTCDLPGKGRYLVRIFSGTQQYGTYQYVGQFEANRE